MCFRPAAAASSITCPNCGAACAPFFDECMECGFDLTEAKAAAEEEASGASATPAAPGAPSAPAAPGAPAAPKAPGAPVAPRS